MICILYNIYIYIQYVIWCNIYIYIYIYIYIVLYFIYVYVICACNMRDSSKDLSMSTVAKMRRQSDSRWFQLRHHFPSSESARIPGWWLQFPWNIAPPCGNSVAVADPEDSSVASPAARAAQASFLACPAASCPADRSHQAGSLHSRASGHSHHRTFDFDLEAEAGHMSSADWSNIM